MTDSDKKSWELGWDFAHFGWPIPEDVNRDFCDGYRAFKHGGQRGVRKKLTIYEKKWLQLRMSAWRRGKYFDPEVTPDVLESLMPFDKCCPVTQERFTFGTQSDTDWSVERADNNQHYVRETLIIISVRANSAKSNLSFERISKFADGTLANDRLSQREWQRLVELVAPLNNAPGFRGVMYLEGQKVAEGVAMTPLAHFQTMMARVAIEEKGTYDPLRSAIFYRSLCDQLCQTKKEVRAFRQLLFAVRQRAKHMRHADRLWATPKVHRRLGEFLRVIGPDPDRYMERLHHGMEEAVSEILKLADMSADMIPTARVR